MRVFDGFTFNDELDLLELRLRTLDPVVDVFVIVELPWTFRLTDKPLYFADNNARFAPWADKIRYVKIPQATVPLEPHPVLEHFQRRQIERGMRDAESGDLLLIGDVDEIPDPEVVRARRASLPEHPYTCVQRLYYYQVNRFVTDCWPGTVIMPRGCVQNLDCEFVREQRFHFPKIENGGWHFSWLGNEAQIANKLRSIDVARDAEMHGSADIKAPDPEDTEWLRSCREVGYDLFGRAAVHQVVPVPTTLPVPMLQWIAEHPEYVA